MIYDYLAAGTASIILAAVAAVGATILLAYPLERSPINTPDMRTPTRNGRRQIFTGWGFIVFVSHMIWLVVAGITLIAALGFVLVESGMFVP